MGDGKHEDHIAGLDLTRVAALRAALAEPLPLAEALAWAKLDAAAWTQGESAWSRQLADDEKLRARYEAELARAQDRLARSIDPIDTDIAGWVAFLAAYNAAPKPAAFLASHGLGPNDLARLKRAWERRTKADPALERRAAELARRPGPPPALRVGPRARARASVDSAPAASRPTPGTPPRDSAREELDSARLRDHRRFGTQVTATPPAPEVATPVQPSGLRTLAEERTRTGFAFTPPRPALPFKATPSRAYLDALSASGAEPGDGSDGSTARIDRPPPLVPKVVAAPARPSPTSSREPVPASQRAAPFAAPRRLGPSGLPVLGGDDDDHDHDSDHDDDRDHDDNDHDNDATRVKAHPTAPLRAAVPPGPASRPTSRSGLPVLGADEPDTGTEILETLTRRGAPPSKPSAPSSQRTDRLSVERHASLTVELAATPGRAAEILARYEVNPIEKAAADAHYKRLFGTNPEIRAAWDRAFDAARARLRRG